MRENASGPTSLRRNSVCVCVSVLGKHLHQNQTWVWASDPCEEHSVLPSGCCLSNDFTARGCVRGVCQMKDQLWEGAVHNVAIPMGAVNASPKPQDVKFPELNLQLL